jgi:putative MATE family efflux protein
MHLRAGTEDDFWKKLITLTIPIIAQILVGTFLNLIDNLMVGQLGDTSIAGVALGNQVFFVLSVFLFGITGSGGIFIAQYWGKRDLAAIHRVQGLCLAFSSGLAAFFAAVCIAAPQWVIGLYSRDPDVIKLGGAYLRIAAIGYLPMAVTQAYATTLRSTEQVKPPMLVSILALGINTALNYLLIFGHMGLPVLGVRGAAIATVFARCVECGLLLGFVYGRRMHAAASMQSMVRQRREFFPCFFKTSVPVLFHEGFYAVGTTLYSTVYAHISTAAVASVEIGITMEKLAGIMAWGMADACAIMVGNRIGAGEKDKAYAYSKRFLRLSLGLGALGGLIVMGLREPVLSLYQISDSMRAITMGIFVIIALALPFRAFDFTMVVGVLRSGGDTRYNLFLEAGSIWFLGLPVAVVTGLIAGWPVTWVYAAVACVEELFRVSLGTIRFVRKKWIHNLVEHETGSPCIPRANEEMVLEG